MKVAQKSRNNLDKKRTNLEDSYFLNFKTYNNITIIKTCGISIKVRYIEQ